ncbi:MAG: hypothetical protein BWY74_03469 [Firmicutes bacterium ADurb.Bin419]|nr:MAG: hypothetical protein BWY74_03469 [Firmicutes bacterium ADurb.Bin419]
MSLSTVKNINISMDGVKEYGYQKTLYLTTQVALNILNAFFSQDTLAYSVVLNNLSKFSDEVKGKVLHILPSFNYTERKLPAILVDIGDVVEAPIYIGTDNVIASGLTSLGNENVYTGADKVTIILTVMGESPDYTRNLADLVKTAIVNYFRWHYFFVGDDGSTFSIATATNKVKVSAQNEVPEDDGGRKIIYFRLVTFSVFTQSTFKDSLEHSASVYKTAGVDIEDADSEV